MPWLQATTTAGHTDPEPIEAVFTELGAEATWLSDAGDQPVLEPAPGATPLWPECIVTALFPAEASREQIAAAFAGLLPADGLHFSELEDADWQSRWQQSLQPMRFGAQLWVVPDASAELPPGAVRVQLAPGMAFGTGEHPTTAMCLAWLAGLPLGDCRVLDYGCGSGLLAIAALALGAAEATAVDIDPQALTATRSNAAANGCDNRLAVGTPAEFPPAREYDVLVANILSGTLIELAPTLQGYLRPGAPMALTGILAHQAEAVRTAWSAFAELAVGARQDDWVLLCGHLHRHG